MKIAIIGVGGIGGYIASKLCEAYGDGHEHEIVFIQRGEHFRRIKESGLVYIAKNEMTVKPHYIYETTENAGIFDLIIINVKSRDLEQTALSLQKNIHPKSAVITTLNGVNNAKRLQKVLPSASILNGCIYVSAAIVSPGIVRQTGGAGSLFFGPENGEITPYGYIEKVLNDAGIKAVLSSNIVKVVWEKYILISAWASISSKYALPLGAILADDEKRQELQLLLEEIAAIAKVMNIGLDDTIIQQSLNRYAQLPYENKTSMQLDIEAGKLPEIDIMTKFIVDTGTELGVEVPAHRNVLQTLGYL